MSYSLLYLVHAIYRVGSCLFKELNADGNFIAKKKQEGEEKKNKWPIEFLYRPLLSISKLLLNIK